MNNWARVSTHRFWFTWCAYDQKATVLITLMKNTRNVFILFACSRYFPLFPFAGRMYRAMWEMLKMSKTFGFLWVHFHYVNRFGHMYDFDSVSVGSFYSISLWMLEWNVSNIRRVTQHDNLLKKKRNFIQ